MSESKRKKQLWWIIGFGVPVFIVVIAVVLAALVFEPRRPRPEMSFNFVDTLTQARLASDLYQELRKIPVPESSKITLSQAEVGSLIRCAEFADAMMRPDPEGEFLPLTEYCLDYQNGIWHAVIPVDTGKKWCFGGVIYLDVYWKMQLLDRELKLGVDSIRAGDLGIPDFAAEMVAEKLVQEVVKLPEYQLLISALSDVRVLPDGGLEFTYSPLRTMELCKGLDF